MADPLQNLKSGDPIPTSVRTWNPILASARAHSTTASPSAGAPIKHFRADVRIKNTTGSQLDRGDVVFVDPDNDPIFLPADSVEKFQSWIVLQGTKWVNTKPQPRTAFVLAEPAADDAIVGAHCTGVVGSKINILNADHKAVIYKHNTNQFETADDGWPIVWAQTGTGDKWAYVDLSSRTDIYKLIPLTLEQTGGAAGSPTVATSWTYTVANAITGEELGTAVDPEDSPHLYRRETLGKLIAAIAGTGFYNSSGTFVILHIHEPIDPSEC